MRLKPPTSKMLRRRWWTYVGLTNLLDDPTIMSRGMIRVRRVYRCSICAATSFGNGLPAEDELSAGSATDELATEDELSAGPATDELATEAILLIGPSIVLATLAACKNWLEPK